MSNKNRKENMTRELPKLPTTPFMSDNLILALSDLCCFQSSIVDPELLFVFGSNILHKEIGEKIMVFLNRYVVPTVLITRGIANYESSFYEPIAESELILSYVQQENHSNTRFVIENGSKNTLENITFSKILYDLETINSIAFISHSYASMRSSLTLKKYCLSPKLRLGSYPITIPSNDPNTPVDIDNWFKTEYGRKLVWGEYLRFKTYGTRGDFPIGEVQSKLHDIDRIISA